MKNFVLIFLSVSLIKLYKIFLGTSHKGVTSRPKFSTKKNDRMYLDVIFDDLDFSRTLKLVFEYDRT